MRTPWQVKVAAKLLLSRLPIDYSTWRRLSMFKLGEMEDPDYAISVFERHFQRSGLERSRGFTVLELGPGDSLGSALIARSAGASQSYLVDVKAFARMDLAPYHALAARLEQGGRPTPSIATYTTIGQLLDACGATYLTHGLSSLRGLPSGSVDFIWSHAVLEHIQRDIFDATIIELRRLLKAGGAMSHRVDLQDHLAESLNSLRFSMAHWESRLFRESGFYTNRLRASEIVRACTTAGFDVQLTQVDRWDHVPIKPNRLAREFRRLPEDDLRIQGFDLTARHATALATTSDLRYRQGGVPTTPSHQPPAEQPTTISGRTTPRLRR